MFTHILVPLDGSRLAESVLPTASYLAKLFSASITLIHVIEKNAPHEIHGERHLGEPEEAEAYLREVADRSFPTGTVIDWHVHSAAVEGVATSIAAHVGELDSDLVVMCTHGHGGVKDVFFGTIAQQVIAAGKTPVLILYPEEDSTTRLFSFNHRDILVPLDGQPEHEQALDKIKDLARACGASLYLVLVAPTRETLPGKWSITRRMLPGSTSELLNMEAQSAEEYLLFYKNELENDGFRVTTEVLRGDPVEAIGEQAEKLQVGLIALGTHGKSPLDAFWEGSVGPKIYKQSKIPLLVIPV
ncbi:MAG: universal stress protein [Candidatus Omnitrophota bacterium]